MKTSLALYILIKNRAAGRRGVYVTVEESRESILRTMRHHGLGTEEDFLVDIARLRVEHEGAEEIRDGLRAWKDFLFRRNRRAKMRHTNHSRDYFVLTYDKGFAARPYEAPKPSRWRRRT